MPERRIPFMHLIVPDSSRKISPAFGRVNAVSLQHGIITDTDLSMLDNLDLLQTINNGYLFLNH